MGEVQASRAAVKEKRGFQVTTCSKKRQCPRCSMTAGLKYGQQVDKVQALCFINTKPPAPRSGRISVEVWLSM